jgi:DNA-binding transcriptional LysR family regulator
MLDVKRLVLLRDLAEYGTVTAVAELHQVTPSAVSQQLRTLESEAGTALLHREGRTVRLTAAGGALAAQIEHVLAALEQAHSTVRALDDQVSGEIVIGCVPSALEPVAAPVAAELVRRHPRLRPRIVEAEPEEALPLLKQRDLDLAVSYRYRHLGTPLAGGLTARTLFDDPLALAVPESLRQAVERNGLGVLCDRPWISAPEPSACRTVLLHACHTAGFTPAIEHSYHDLRAALSLVAAGLGVTILPGMMCRTPPPGAAILPLPDAGRTMEAVIRTGTARHPAVAAALAVLSAGPRA